MIYLLGLNKSGYYVMEVVLKINQLLNVVS